MVSLARDTTANATTTVHKKETVKRPKRKRISDMRVDFRRLKSVAALRSGARAAMYESSCSYAGALELKRSALKEEPWPGAEWPPYRLHQSTFEQLKQSVEKAKAALQDRSGLLGSAAAFGDLYGGPLAQDAATTALGFGRTARADDSMLTTIELKNKSLGADKLGGAGLVKGYSTPSLSDTLRAPKCSVLILRKEEERIEEEMKKHEEKMADLKRKQAMGEEIEIEEEIPTSVQYTAEELKAKDVYRNISLIQAMERSRRNTRANRHKKNQDQMTYLELAGLKKPPAPLVLREKAAALIKMVCRKYMQLKREHIRENKVKERLGMTLPAFLPPSLNIQWERVKSDRRKFRQAYFHRWLKENINENTRIMRLRRDDIMEDISKEIRAWFQSWYTELGLFDEYPWPDEGGSILVVRGDTFTFEEYREWRKAEDKRLMEEGTNPKTKEEIRAEKKAEKEEKKRLKQEEIIREKKAILEYKKSRMNPEKDPGIIINVSDELDAVRDAYNDYRTKWKDIDLRIAPLDVTRGYIMEMITENQYQNINIEIRPIVDEMMRLELVMLKQALKNDYLNEGINTVPMSQKRKKPKAKKIPKDKNKRTPANMFQELVDNGIVRNYPKIKLEDFWGEQNYAAADLRAVPWLPKFPAPCIGDVREEFRNRCLMALGSNCRCVQRATLLAGPRSCGKRTLVYAVATETNAVLMDLSPINVYNKYPGPKNLKTMVTLVNKMSRLMQPTVIIVEDAEKIFYKKVPKEEKDFDPTRLKNLLFKDIIKPLRNDDKILVLGTSSEPWVAAIPAMKKAFSSVILFPRTDYASLSTVLYRLLMKYHGVNREFDVHSVAQVARGYNISSIKKAISELMKVERIVKLNHDPLKPVEVLSSVLDHGLPPIDEEDYELFKDWYSKYSSWGPKFDEYKLLLEVQYDFKLKNDKKKQK